MSRLYYRGAHACLLCYDITDENSFLEMAGWLRELRANRASADDEPPLVIHVVGTKSDIVALDPASRRVPFERTIAYVAEQLYPSRASTPPPTATGLGVGGGGGGGGGILGNPSASAAGLQSPDSTRSSGFWGQEIGWDCCHEISAKDGEGIEEVFRVISRKLVEQRNRRDGDSALSVAGTPGLGDSAAGPFTPGGMDGTASFRLGAGDKRRSWMGLGTPVIGEEQVMETARRRGRCC